MDRVNAIVAVFVYPVHVELPGLIVVAVVVVGIVVLRRILRLAVLDDFHQLFVEADGKALQTDLVLGEAIEHGEVFGVDDVLVILEEEKQRVLQADQLPFDDGHFLDQVLLRTIRGAPGIEKSGAEIVEVLLVFAGLDGVGGAEA